MLPHCDEAFFVWLATVDCSKIKIRAIKEGSVVFPRVPLIIVEVCKKQLKHDNPAYNFLKICDLLPLTDRITHEAHIQRAAPFA